MIRRRAWIWAAVLLLLACMPAAAAGADPAAGRVYEHPARKYVVTLPEGTRLREPGGTVDIAIDSDKGYGIILQSTDATPSTTISETAAILESAYLGPDKPWARKIRQEVSLVAGLVAFNGQYEGDGAIYRVVITRGPVNSYTFVFRARAEQFAQLNAEFEALLAAFRPAPGDRPAAAAPPDAASSAAPSAAPAGPDAVADGSGRRRFAERRLGYSLEYDAGWILERPSPEAVMLSGGAGTDAFYATVSVQNTLPPAADTAVQAASIAMDQIRGQFEKQAKDVAYERQGPYIYKKDDLFLLGQEFLVTYRLGPQAYRQWSVVVPRPEGKVAHIWTYRAPADRFARHLKAAERILESWSIAKVEADDRKQN